MSTLSQRRIPAPGGTPARSRPARLLAAALALLGAGCVETLSPLYGPHEETFDPALVGRWQMPVPEERISPFKLEQARDGLTWTFARWYSTSLYTLDVGEGEGRFQFSVKLVELGPHRFLDLWARRQDLGDSRYNADRDSQYHHLVFETHRHLKVVQLEPTLVLVAMDQTWLNARLKARPDDAPHWINPYNGEALLTGSVEQLRAFFTRYADNPEAFKPSQHLKFTRQPPAAPGDRDQVNPPPS